MGEAASYALFVRLLPSVFLFWLAWAVSRSPYRSSSNRTLSLFFLVVGLGFLLEFMAELVQPISPWSADVLSGIGTLAGVVDPALLLLFSLSFPQVHPRRRSRVLWVSYGCAALATLIVSWNPSSRLALLTQWESVIYVNGTYLACFLVLLQGFLHEQYTFRKRQLFFVVLGVAFAGLSRSVAFFTFGFAHLLFAEFIVLSLAASLLLVLAFMLGVRMVRPRLALQANKVFAWVAVLLVGFSASLFLVLELDGLFGFGSLLVNQYFGLRWLVVGSVLGYGILRHQLFNFELRARQAVLFLVSLVIALLVAFAVALAVGPGTGITAARLAGLAAGAVVFGLAYVGLGLVWRRLGAGADLPVAYQQRRVELYEAALEYALGGAQLSLGERLFADTLREALGITAEEHERILKRLEAEAWARPPA